MTGRPKKRPDVIETEFFKAVSDIWTPPKRRPVDPKYHQAINALADWAGPEWHETESGFWILRHYLMTACEKWKDHDWQSDIRRLRLRKAARTRQPDLVRAVRTFRRESEKSLDQQALYFLTIEILTAFFPDQVLDISRGEGLRLTAQSLTNLERYVSRPDNWPVAFGPLEYDRFPQKLPSARTAIAVVLADIVTTRRHDENQKAASLVFPRKPELSGDLPWVSIALFANAICDDGNDVGPEGIVKSVKNAFERVSRIYWTPETR